MTNIREHLNWTSGYHAINREERNLAAIFYHALLVGENLERFLSKINCLWDLKRDEAGIYFEYAYLRDLWFHTKGDEANEKKRRLIYGILQPGNLDALQAMSPLEFNRYFGVGNCSKTEIQSPVEWSIDRFAPHIADNAEFERVCHFKWAFKIKPDIVIHPTDDTAICIEAKLASGEATYPSKPSEKAEFKRRNLSFIRQTALQRYLMEALLGLQTQYIFLVQRKGARSATHTTLLWQDAFEGLDTSQSPIFVQKWLQRLFANS